MSVRIINQDALTALRTLPDESVQTCITSPPYFQLRDYKCDGQIGLEATPEAFITALLDVFDEVRRVLRKDGTVWCNLGDSYSGSGKGTPGPNAAINHVERQGFVGASADARNGTAVVHKTGGTYGIPGKNLLLIPERFAIAMQEAGWYVRSRIAWCKTSAMPESVLDRPSSAWEHIWLFSKSRMYFYDAEAVRTAASDSTLRDRRTPTSNPPGWSGNPYAIGIKQANPMASGATSANLRNYWLSPHRKPLLRLRPDLTPEQRFYVADRLAAHMRRGLP